MNREVHVRFCEGVGVKFPRATRPLIHTALGFHLSTRFSHMLQKASPVFLLRVMMILKPNRSSFHETRITGRD